MSLSDRVLQFFSSRWADALAIPVRQLSDQVIILQQCREAHACRHRFLIIGNGTNSGRRENRILGYRGSSLSVDNSTFFA